MAFDSRAVDGTICWVGRAVEQGRERLVERTHVRVVVSVVSVVSVKHLSVPAVMAGHPLLLLEAANSRGSPM
jgi:hypothetical protein